METLDYKEYNDLLNDETRKYLENVLKTKAVLNYYSLDVPSKKSAKMLYPYLNAYWMSFPEGRNILFTITKYGFEYYNVNKYSYEFSKSFSFNGLSKIFGSFDLSQVENPEDLILMTPEDMLLKVINDVKDNFNISDSFKYIDYDNISILEDISKTKHMQYQAKIDEEQFKGLNAGDINYLENAGKIFSYLKDKSENVTIVDPTENNLRGISLIGSLFISNYEDKKYILDYFYKKSFSYYDFKKIFDLDFDKDELDSYDPTLVLNYYFKTFDSNLCKVLADEELSVVLTKLLGNFNISVKDLSSFSKNIVKIRKLNDNIDDFKKELDMGNRKLFKDIFNMYLTLQNSECLLNMEFINLEKANDFKRVAI